MKLTRRLTYAVALCLSALAVIPMPLGSPTSAFAAPSSGGRSSVPRVVSPPEALTHAFPLGQERLGPPVSKGVRKRKARSSSGDAGRQGAGEARAAATGSADFLGLSVAEIVVGGLVVVAAAGGVVAFAVRRRRRRATTSTDIPGVEAVLIAGRAQPSRPAYGLIERSPRAVRAENEGLGSPSPEGDQISADQSPGEAQVIAAEPEGTTRWRSVQKAALLGRRLERGGRLDAAEEAYRRASEAGSVGAAYNLGVVRRGRGDREGAEAAFRLAGGRGDADALFNLGLLAFENGDRVGAEDAWRRADARGHRLAAANLGYVLINHGDRAGAIAAYERAKDRGDQPGTRYLALEISR